MHGHSYIHLYAMKRMGKVRQRTAQKGDCIRTHYGFAIKMIYGGRCLSFSTLAIFLPLVVHLPSKLKWHTRRFVRSGPWTFWILSAFTHCGYVRNAIYFKVTNCFLFRVAMKRKSHGCDGNRQFCFLCKDIWVE